MKVNYKEKKLLSSEEMSEKEVLLAVKKESLQLQATLLASESAMEDTKARLEDLKTSYPLDIQKIIDTQLELEAQLDGIKRAKALKEELGL